MTSLSGLISSLRGPEAPVWNTSIHEFIYESLNDMCRRTGKLSTLSRRITSAGIDMSAYHIRGVSMPTGRMGPVSWTQDNNGILKVSSPPRSVIITAIKWWDGMPELLLALTPSERAVIVAAYSGGISHIDLTPVQSVSGEVRPASHYGGFLYENSEYSWRSVAGVNRIVFNSGSEIKQGENVDIRYWDDDIDLDVPWWTTEALSLRLEMRNELRGFGSGNQSAITQIRFADTAVMKETASQTARNTGVVFPKRRAYDEFMQPFEEGIGGFA